MAISTISDRKAVTYPGAVLQVVQGTLGGTTAITSSSFVDTGLSATITPISSSSKILIIATLSGVAKNGTNNCFGTQLVRGSTAILGMNGIAAYNGGTGYNGVGDITCNYLDSPATTLATTYKIQVQNWVGGTISFNQIYTANYTVTSTITLMEIAA